MLKSCISDGSWRFAPHDEKEHAPDYAATRSKDSHHGEVLLTDLQPTEEDLQW